MLAGRRANANDHWRIRKPRAMPACARMLQRCARTRAATVRLPTLLFWYKYVW